jgi:hypothetical protein
MFYKVSFKWIQEVCKVSELGRFTCDNPNKITRKCGDVRNHKRDDNLGECNEEVCPLLKMEIEKEVSL